MGKSTGGADRNPSAAAGLPLTLTGDGSSGNGTLERIAAVWNLQLPPLLKLVSLKMASGWTMVAEIAEFAGCSEDEADAAVEGLVERGVFR